MYSHPTATLSDAARAEVGEILNLTLADEFALSSAARDYHWNVTGPQFRSLNELFDEQYRELDRWVERIGERARSLGITARTGWSELIRAPRICPARGADLSATCMMGELINLHDRVAEQLRADVKACNDRCRDFATAQLLQHLVEYHETAAWVLGELMENHEMAHA